MSKGQTKLPTNKEIKELKEALTSGEKVDLLRISIGQKAFEKSIKSI